MQDMGYGVEADGAMQLALKAMTMDSCGHEKEIRFGKLPGAASLI